MKTITWDKNNIATIINTRLQMQSTQKSLETEFGVNIPDISALRDYIADCESWDKSKRNMLIKTVGGTANFKKTQKYLGLVD
jgi:uncharacterized protein YaaN involved in tellurite resistance